MNPSSVQFVLSAASSTQFPELDWPEVAFAGRSNVGKSSLLNMLLGRRKLVKVSNTPGRTRLINFFSVNESFHMVDLPGYGFAKAPKSVRRDWQQLMVDYLRKRDQLAAVVLLLDVRRQPNAEDMAVLDLFRQAELPTILAITKADKLPLQRRKKQVTSITKALNLAPGDVHVTSAQTRQGREELWSALECFLDLEPIVPDDGPCET